MEKHGEGHVEDSLAAFLDGEMTPEEAERVRAHVGECPRCARALEEMRAVVAALREESASSAEPVRPMWPAVQAGISSRQRFGLSFGIAASLAAAAGVVIGIALGSAVGGGSVGGAVVESEYTETIVPGDYAMTLDEIYVSVVEEGQVSE